MSDQIDPNVDPYGYLGIIRNADGSITRPQVPNRPFPTTTLDHSSVFMKDHVINPSKDMWARIIVPRQVLNSENKLPLIVYFHGGGFVMAATVDTPILQKFYATLAAEIPAIIVSVDYRYAPENRLPAAYDDSVESLHWIKNTPDELLKKYADFSKCFLLGTSAGGNIVYHVGLRVAGVSHEYLKPLEIKGLILHHAFFGGNERTESELRLARDKTLSLNVSDIMWELGLPIDSDRDHTYCNPTVEIRSNENLFDQVKRRGWKILVIDCDGDPLIDRQIEVSKMLKEKGVQVVDSFSEGGFHGCEFFDDVKLKEMALVVKEFVRA